MSEYSAGLTSNAIWLSEFKKCVDLYQNGMTSEDIKWESDNNNIFQLPSKDRAKRASRNLISRIEALPENIVHVFPDLDISNQKIVALLSFMLTNQLVDDFMYEAYRDELVLGDRVLEDYEVESFMIRKQTEVEKVSKWSEKSISRLKQALKTLLRDAGLLEIGDKGDNVIQPYLDDRLENMMIAAHLNRQLASFKGVS